MTHSPGATLGRRRRLGWCLPVLALSLAPACSGDQPAPTPDQTSVQPSAAATAPTSGTSTEPASPSADESDPGPDTKPSSVKSASPAPDPTAPSTVTPAQRSKTVKTRISANAGTFRKGVRWSDGLRLDVVAIVQSTQGGRGRGSQPGSPQTTFALELTNGSSKTVDARQVVVTTTYATGSTSRIAPPVYGTSTQDFGVRLKPTTNATAKYAFSIPKKRLGAITVTVDLDATHELARFTGSAR